MGSMATGNIAIELGIHGPTYLTGTACSSGADAIGTASRLIESGECDIVIAGGSEAPITPLVVSSFTKLGALSKILICRMRHVRLTKKGMVLSSPKVRR